MPLRPAPAFEAGQLIDLAKTAKVHDEPWFQHFARAAVLANDPELVQTLVEVLRPRAIDELLKGIPFTNPSADELRAQVEARCPILFGRLFDTDVPFLQSAHLGAQHMLILGATGSGKTNLMYGLGLQARAHGISSWFIDRDKQDYRHLLRMWPELVVLDVRRDLKLNPMEVPAGVDPAAWLASFVTIFVKSNNLLDGSESLLLRVLTGLYRDHGIFDGSLDYPTLYDLRGRIVRLKIPRYSRESGFRDSIKNRLDAYLTTNPDCYAVIRGMALPELEQHSLVLEARGLSERHVRCLLSWLVHGVFARRIAAGERGSSLRLQIFIDECKDIIPKGYNANLGYSPIASLLAQSREVGVGYVWADQTAQLEDAAFVQSRTKLCMRLGSGEDIDRVRKAFALSKEQAAFIARLDTGQAIIRVPRLDPFLIEIPRVRLQ